MDMLEITLPKSWGELTQRQLRRVYVLMVRFAGMPEAWRCVAASCALRWAGIKVVSPYGRNWLIRTDGREYVMDPMEYACLIDRLSWLRDIPEVPVRLDVIDKASALPPDPTADLTFGRWLVLENLYQGYQYTQDSALLRSMAAVLYGKEDIALSPAEEISIFYWWSAVKTMVSAMFPFFFRPAPVKADDVPDADTVRRSVDAQIRALTKGDISKEDRIMEMPAIRALTELDAQAREFEELNRKYPQKSMS